MPQIPQSLPSGLAPIDEKYFASKNIKKLNTLNLMAKVKNKVNFKTTKTTKKEPLLQQGGE